MDSETAKLERRREWDRVTHLWADAHRKHLKLEAWFTALCGIFASLAILIIFFAHPHLQTVVVILWLVLLAVLALCLPLLIVHCFKEWRLFQPIFDLDQSFVESAWISGKAGKIVSFLNFRRVPYDPIRDAFIQLAVFGKKALRNTKNGR